MLDGTVETPQQYTGPTGKQFRVFEIQQPGQLIDVADINQRRDLNRILTQLNIAFFDVNSAFNEFENQKFAEATTHEPDWSELTSLSAEISGQFPPIVHNTDKSSDTYEADLEKALTQEFDKQARLKRAKWERYGPPALLEKAKIFRARNFLFSIDMFEKILSKLAKEDGAPAGLQSVVNEFHTVFTDVKGVRDSTAHTEDRIRGKAREKSIAVKPLPEYSEGPGVVWFHECLENGYLFSSTMADGELGRVAITVETMIKLSDIYTKALETFSWRGLKTLLPET